MIYSQRQQIVFFHTVSYSQKSAQILINLRTGFVVLSTRIVVLSTRTFVLSTRVFDMSTRVVDTSTRVIDMSTYGRASRLFARPCTLVGGTFFRNSRSYNSFCSSFFGKSGPCKVNRTSLRLLVYTFKVHLYLTRSLIGPLRSLFGRLSSDFCNENK